MPCIGDGGTQECAHSRQSKYKERKGEENWDKPQRKFVKEKRKSSAASHAWKPQAAVKTNLVTTKHFRVVFLLIRNLPMGDHTNFYRCMHACAHAWLSREAALYMHVHTYNIDHVSACTAYHDTTARK